METRKFLRTFILGLVASWALFWVAVLIVSPSPNGGFFGWNLGTDGATITYVTPHAPAERAGIRVGDRIDWRTLPLFGRANLALLQSGPPGVPLHVTVHHAAAVRHVTIAAQRWDEMLQDATRLSFVAGLVLLLIGIVLVHLRPTRMTWAFLLIFLNLGLGIGTSPVWALNVPWIFLLANGGWDLLSGTATAGMLIFMSRFPGDRARGPLVLLDRVAIPAGALVAILGLFIDITLVYSSAPPPSWALFANEYVLSVLITLVALCALVISYSLATSSDRQRIVPVLVAFACFVAAQMATNVYAVSYTSLTGNMILTALSSLSMLALAIAVANGVIRHRVIDVSFVVSRTLVYSILTSMIVGAFVLIDFLSSKVLERLQIAIFLEVATALIFGISLNALHARIDRFIDAVLFRRRHLAEKRLERAARTLAHAETATFIDEALVVEACDVLALASAAVFRRNGNNEFARVLEAGWNKEDSSVLTREDHLVVNLLTELQPVDLLQIRWPNCKVPGGIAQPLLAIPFVVRHELLGFVLYGGHVGGEAIDPDERRTLVRLADAAADGYEHLHAKELMAETNELRTQLLLVTRENEVLRTVSEPRGSIA